MSIKAFELFGDVELRTAKLRSGVRDADSQFKHIENHAKSTVNNVNRELGKLGQFKSNLNQGFMSSFGIQGGGGVGSLLGSGAGNLLQTGAKALFGHVTDAIDKGMQMKDLIEQMRIAFTNLTGSEEKAVVHMRELFKFGADTPFKTRDLLDYSQQLQAVGVSASDVKQELTDLGDAMAKAGTFQRMDKAILAITQMRSKGKITGEELNQQLSEALPGARGYLARGLGVAQPELNKLLEEGRLNAEAALKLMFLQMRKEAAGTMKETATKTMAGLQSTLEDNQELTYALGVTGGDPFGAAGGAYAQRMENLKKQIGMYSGPEAQGIATKVGSNAETYYKGVGILEDNAFKSATGRDTIMKMFTDPKGAAADIYNGLTQGLSAGTGAVTGALNSMSSSMWDTWSGFWETNSPSKRAERLGTWIAEGLEMGLNKGQSRNYANLKALSQADPNFVRTLAAEASKRGVNPDDMLNLIGIESGFNKSVVNQFGYGGLGQVGRSERGALGLPQSDAAFKQMLETHSASWQITNVLMPFLDMKLGQNKGVRSGGISLAELYAMWGSGHATGDPNAVHMARGGKRSSAYANNPLWDANKDGVVREAEFGVAARRSLGAGQFFSINGKSDVSNNNPMPVAVVGSFAGFEGGAGGVKSLVAGTSMRYQRRGGVGTLDDPVPVAVEITAALEPLNSELNEMYKVVTITKKPLIDVKEAMQGIAGLDSEMAALRKDAIKPEEAEKKKKDRLFDKAFTREGVAGDFQGGFASLLSGLGWEKPTSLLRQFGIGLIQSIQGRLANDLSAMLTGSLFGNRGENGQLSGGVLQSLFGGLFGGHRASGGGMSAGRIYVAGEHGQELVMGPGHVYNASQTRAMLGGGGGENRTIVAIGDRAIGEAVDAYRNSGRGRRARLIQGKYGRLLQGVSYA